MRSTPSLIFLLLATAITWLPISDSLGVCRAVPVFCGHLTPPSSATFLPPRSLNCAGIPPLFRKSKIRRLLCSISCAVSYWSRMAAPLSFLIPAISPLLTLINSPSIGRVPWRRIWAASNSPTSAAEPGSCSTCSTPTAPNAFPALLSTQQPSMIAAPIIAILTTAPSITYLAPTTMRAKSRHLAYHPRLDSQWRLLVL